MTIDTFYKAHDLNKKLNELNQALNCFEYRYSEHSAPISTNPRIIIEYDGGDDREQISLPIALSNTLVEILKAEIINATELALSEFTSL